eukprot:1143036-Pelagomonas_calceolata.AAC.3
MGDAPLKSWLPAPAPQLYSQRAHTHASASPCACGARSAGLRCTAPGRALICAHGDVRAHAVLVHGAAPQARGGGGAAGKQAI